MIPLKYKLFKKYFHKCKLIDAKEGFIQFLKNESILLDIDNISIIEPEIMNEIKTCFEEYEYIFVKLNCSSSNDAEFMLQDNQCFNVDDLLISLKSSTKVFENTNFQESYLILKKWYKIDRKFEFRLFFIGDELKSISQRHINEFFEYEIQQLEEILLSIEKFHKELKQNEEISEFLKNEKFTFIDVYFLVSSYRIKIIDVLTEKERQSLIQIYQSNNENEEDHCEKPDSCNYSDENYFMLNSNWNQISELNKLDIFYIENENDVIIQNENVNKFPIEINESSNIDQIIKMMKENENN